MSVCCRAVTSYCCHSAQFSSRAVAEEADSEHRGGAAGAASGHSSGLGKGAKLDDILAQMTIAKKAASAGSPVYEPGHDATQSSPVRHIPKRATTAPPRSPTAASSPAPAPPAKRPRGRRPDPTSKAGLLREKRALKAAAAAPKPTSRRVKVALLSDEDDADAGEEAATTAVVRAAAGMREPSWTWCCCLIPVALCLFMVSRLCQRSRVTVLRTGFYVGCEVPGRLRGASFAPCDVLMCQCMVLDDTFGRRATCS